MKQESERLYEKNTEEILIFNKKLKNPTSINNNRSQ